MNAPLDVWFDYSCPYAYLGSTQVEALAARTGAELRFQPMLLGGVFRARGTPQNLSEVLAPAKARHNLADMHRWAKHFGVPLSMPVGHPRRTVEALRATLITGIDPRVIHAFFRAYWVEGRDIAHRGVISDVLSAAGHDPAPVLARLDEPSIKDDLRVRTDRAIALGIFGAPSFVVGDQLHWGQDRLGFVERALGGRTDEPLAPPVPGRTLEAFFDFSSPFAYLGMTQVEGLAERTGATLIVRPMLLGAVFKELGHPNVPLATFSPEKQRFVAEDLVRWSEHWAVPYRFPSRFPTNSVKALRVYLALEEPQRRAFRDAVFRAYWAEDQDISADGLLAELAGADALARSQTPAIKQALFDATELALGRGVFGAPTFVIDGTELYWGQDRLGLVEAALRAPMRRDPSA